MGIAIAVHIQFKNSACALPAGKRDLFLISQLFLLDCNETEWRAKPPASHMCLASNLTSSHVEISVMAQTVLRFTTINQTSEIAI